MSEFKKIKPLDHSKGELCDHILAAYAEIDRLSASQPTAQGGGEVDWKLHAEHLARDLKAMLEADKVSVARISAARAIRLYELDSPPPQAANEGEGK